MAKQVRKIIYFDKETILNILQELNKGSKQSQTGTATSFQSSTEIEAEAGTKLNVNMPFVLRLSFLFTGRINARFLIKKERETTITSTEISEFDELKPRLVYIPNIQLSDVENSSTLFRVAGSYLRFVSGQVADIDVKEFNAVMNGFEGHDTYKVDNDRYVRFNNAAFVSNYKRNDLLTAKMTLYCIKVGNFYRDSFDFMKQLNKMQEFFSNINAGQTLADLYPPMHNEQKLTSTNSISSDVNGNEIQLYDVVYACIATENE